MVDKREHVVHAAQGEELLEVCVASVVAVAVAEALRLGASAVRFDDRDGGVCVYELQSGTTLAQDMPDVVCQKIVGARDELLAQIVAQLASQGFEVDHCSAGLTVLKPGGGEVLLIIGNGARDVKG